MKGQLRQSFGWSFFLVGLYRSSNHPRQPRGGRNLMRKTGNCENVADECSSLSRARLSQGYAFTEILFQRPFSSSSFYISFRKSLATSICTVLVFICHHFDVLFFPLASGWKACKADPTWKVVRCFFGFWACCLHNISSSSSRRENSTTWSRWEYLLAYLSMKAQNHVLRDQTLAMF